MAGAGAVGARNNDSIKQAHWTNARVLLKQKKKPKRRECGKKEAVHFISIQSFLSHTEHVCVCVQKPYENRVLEETLRL